MTDRAPQRLASSPVRVAGCDLGKASAKFALGTVDGDGAVHLVATDLDVHGGRPLDALSAWYRRAGVASCAALGVTGLHAPLIGEPAVAGLPDDACLRAALDQLGLRDGPLNLISLGARGYAVLSRSADGHHQYLENDKCSSGTGETMVRIAGRFGLDLSQADALACAATGATPITARCSVFAKSEMTHFGNQGKPADALFRGYFDAVATYAAALLARIRVPGPVLLVGGGSQLAAVAAGLGRALDQPVVVPDHARHFEAIGAMVLAAEQQRGESLAPLPDDPARLCVGHRRSFAVLAPARDHAGRVTRLPARPVVPGAARGPCLLGLDLGSTGSKAVLTSIASGEPVLDVYDRTRGNPVGAAGRLIEALLAGGPLDVRAIGLTGSGREAAATVMRAAYPELADRIVVVNEIVAHATAAIRCDPDGGASLSVVEIGGQDAKFIQVSGGQIVESDMNKACSAGTGSFLEEQAGFYGVDDIEEFTRLACQAERPPDLGQMCTVFVADAAAEAHGDGFAVADLFGGFQYSVIHNYINRVMGQRSFARRIFFQGKPASGESLAWTLAAVTGREVVVPPNPGAMGAWGIGLVALDQLGAEWLGAAAPFELHRVLAASVVNRTTLQCRDKRCATFCTIDKTTVELAGARHNVLSGGACPRYEVSSAASHKLPRDAPSAFDQRRAALAAFLAPGGDGPMIGVPELGPCAGYLPWLVTFLRELGFATRVLSSNPGALARGEERCYAFDACAPVKIAHGVLDGDCERVWFPKLLSLADRDGPGGASCVVEQALPEMVAAALRARGRPVEILHPVLELGRGLASPRLAAQLVRAARRLGADPLRVPAAMAAARRAQRAHDQELAAIGDATLAYAAAHDLPVVVVCGALHVVHDRAVNADIPRLVREGGALALPQDCLRIPASVPTLPRVGWFDANRALRSAVAARTRGGVYPLMLTSFGCGPASFSEQIFAALLDGYPHTVLESDGHGGTAGYVTRVQAFLHGVRHHDRRPSPVPAGRLALLDPLPAADLSEERGSRVLMFACADRISPILAAAYRSFGFDAAASDQPDAESLRLARRDCSGKECLPYQLIWGSFRKELERHPPDKRTLLVQVSGDGKCRNCMFSIKDQLSLERLGLDDRVALRHFGSGADLGPVAALKVWLGMTLWDLLWALAAYYRPLELEPGAVDDAYLRWCDRVIELTEQPLAGGWRALPAMVRARRDALTLVDGASEEFAAIVRPEPTTGPSLRTVLLSGDIYVRLDGFASRDLVRRLNQRNLKVLTEPTWVLGEYMAAERLREIIGLPTSRVDGALTRAAMPRLRRDIFERARRRHPWLPCFDADELLAHSRRLLDRHPQGEAPITLGSVMHAWQRGACDGVVVASPWGCPPALVSESLLRHQRDIPMLFVYADGSPPDDRRLNAFAFRLRRQPAAGSA